MLDQVKHRIQRLVTETRLYFKYPEISKYSGTSFSFGKNETIDFVEEICPNKSSRILDVGPGRGTYNKLLKRRGYKILDAVEIYFPYIEKFELEKIYHRVFHCNIVDFEYQHYDIVIMGDVIEHLEISDAQKVIMYAQQHSNLILIAVPYLLEQKGSQLDGSGDHRQPDLTREIFLERYPGFELLIDNDQVGVFYFKNLSLKEQQS